MTIARNTIIKTHDVRRRASSAWVRRRLFALLVAVAALSPASSSAKGLTVIGDFADGKCRRLAVHLAKINFLDNLDDAVSVDRNLSTSRLGVTDDRSPGTSHLVPAILLNGDPNSPSLIAITQTYQPIGDPEDSSKSILFLSAPHGSALDRSSLRLSQSIPVGEVTSGLWQVRPTVPRADLDPASRRTASILEAGFFRTEDLALLRLKDENLLIAAGAPIEQPLQQGSRWILLLSPSQYIASLGRPPGAALGAPQLPYVECVFRFDS